MIEILAEMTNIKIILICGIISISENLCLGQVLITIDYHVHIFSDDLLYNLANRGFIFQGETFEVNCVEESCSKVDKIKANNSDKLVLISAPYAIQIDSENDDSLKLYDFVKRENNFLNKIVNSDRNSFYGFCGINPSWEFALDETVRCINDLNLDGIKFHFQSNQIDLNDAKTQESISEILLFLSEKNIPVLIHLNITDLTNGSGMAKQFIKNFLCNHNKQTIIFAHCGGAGGLYKATLDVLEEFDIFLKTSEFSVNKDIYFELSGTIIDQKYPGKISSTELKKMISKMGHKHFLFGSDFPLRTGKKYIELLKEELDLGAEMLETIKTRNIFEKN